MPGKGQVYSIIGIDTGIGKTIATGLIARGLAEAGVRVISQKAVQTGCVGISEDIEKHRQLMGLPLLPEDLQGLTCSYLYKTPCSPHLAASLENDTIDTARITAATEELRCRYEVVLLEGAGGLFVPLRDEYTLLDYVTDLGWPVILVTSSRLGSINHTLASLEALRHRDLELAGVVYNNLAETGRDIAEDSLRMIALYTRRYGFRCPVIEMYNEQLYTRPGSCRLFAALCGR